MAERHPNHLVQTERHIAQTKALITRQHELIEQRARDGYPVNLAVALLDALEHTLEIFERHRAIILKQGQAA